MTEYKVGFRNKGQIKLLPNTYQVIFPRAWDRKEGGNLRPYIYILSAKRVDTGKKSLPSEEGRELVAYMRQEEVLQMGSVLP